MDKIRRVYRRYHGPSKGALKYHTIGTWRGYGLPAIMKTRSVTTEKLGGKTTYGTVYEFGTDKRYVLKKMKIIDDDDMAIFKNEIRVGTTPGIQRVGPRIYGWKIDSDSGQYIMDNVLLGDSTLVATSLTAYIQKFQPKEDNIVFKKLKTTIRNFWMITKGYHGDLHAENIAVVAKPNGSVVRVMVYDYGSHKRTKTRLTGTFENMTRIINANFARSMAKRPFAVSLYPEGPGYFTRTKTYAPLLGQTRRSNSNVLRATNFRTGKFIKGPGQKSLMNVLLRTQRTPRSKQMTIKNYFR